MISTGEFLIVLFVAFFMGRLARKKGQARYIYWVVAFIIWYGIQLTFALLSGPIRQYFPEVELSFTIFVISMLTPLVLYFMIYRQLQKLPNKEEFEGKIDELGKENESG